MPSPEIAALNDHQDVPSRSTINATPMPQIADHVLLGRAASITEAGDRLAPRLGGDVLADLASAIPAEWLQVTGRDPESYSRFIGDRLAAGQFTAEAEAARVEVQGG